MVGDLPIKKFRSGNISCSIWSNKRNVEKDGKWFDHTITNIRKNDIAKMILLLQKAQEELLLNKEGD